MDEWGIFKINVINKKSTNKAGKQYMKKNWNLGELKEYTKLA